jgi:Uma2 family endonuclease
MVDAGILDADARVELLEGELLAVSPESLPHTRFRRWFTTLLNLKLAERGWEINTDAPALLEPQSAPEPDVYVFPSSVPDSEMKGSDIALAIEISISSLTLDLQRKAPLYARHGIQEYWVVDVVGRRIVVHTQPAADGYSKIIEIASDGEIAPLAFPDVVVRVADLPPST